MNEVFRDFLLSISAFATIFGIAYVYFITRHRERMTMLEKGIDISKLSSKANILWVSLKYGILFIGIAMGILIGNILFTHYGLGKIVSYVSMTFLFGGLSLIIFFLIEKKFRS